MRFTAQSGSGLSRLQTPNLKSQTSNPENQTPNIELIKNLPQQHQCFFDFEAQGAEGFVDLFNI